MFTKTVKSALIFAFISAASLFAADTFAADVKVKIIEHVPNSGLVSGSPPATEITVYVHNKIQRVDYVGYPVNWIGPRKEPAPHTAFIIRCDTHIVYELDFSAREYRKYWLDKFPSQDRLAKAIAQDQKDNQINIVNTGETKDFYGHTARHLVTTIKATDPRAHEEVVDGWYLDIPDPGCAPEYMRQRHVHTETIAARETDGAAFGYFWMAPQGVHAGFWYNWLLPAGLAVEVTSGSPVGLATQATSTSVRPVERKIVEFSEAPIDPSLFEVPSGFKKVRELYKH
jgi:hypothetical protein